MTISVGDNLPSATLLRLGENGPEQIELESLTRGKKTILFGLPGPFTNTCTAAHVPSFIRTADALRAKGIEHIVCYAVSDPWVMDAWGESTGGKAAGIEFVGDGDASFTKALGLNFSAPAVGFHDRTVRNAMYVENGVVKVLNLEEGRGICDRTAGETMLEQV